MVTVFMTLPYTLSRIIVVASVALLGPAVVSVIEDGSEGMMRSSVDICLELVVEVAVERDVVVFLDVENITAGQHE